MMNHALLITQASMLRKKLGEDSSSPINVFSLSQDIEGLTIVFYPFGEKLSGMCIKGTGNNNIVAINSAMTLGRQRFSLAHEFYHLFYDSNMISVCQKNLNSGSLIEKSADMFASYFLMPEDALLIKAEQLASKHKDGLLSFQDVIRIEQFFEVSHQAAVYRLIHTPFLIEAIGNDYQSRPVRIIAETLGYSSDLYKPAPENKQFMTFGNYISQTEVLLEKGLISTGKYEELLLDAFRSDLVFGIDDEDGDVID